MSFLQIKQIRKKIGSVEILKGIDIELENTHNHKNNHPTTNNKTTQHNNKNNATNTTTEIAAKNRPMHSTPASTAQYPNICTLL